MKTFFLFHKSGIFGISFGEKKFLPMGFLEKFREFAKIS